MNQDLVNLMNLAKFTEILEKEGKEAALQFAEEITGEKMERTDKEKPHLRVVDEAVV